MNRVKQRYTDYRCECGAALTLLAWPWRQRKRGYPNLRYLVCLDCGERRRIYPHNEATFTPEQVAEMVRLYLEENYSLRDLARKFIASRSAIKYWLKGEGVKLRPRGGVKGQGVPTAEQDEIDVVDWLYTGLGYSQRQIGERLGTTRDVIQKRMIRHNIPTRNGSDAQRAIHRTEPRSEATRKKMSDKAKAAPRDAQNKYWVK